jgi:hypothetical protein
MYLSFHWYFVLFVSSLIPRSMQFSYIIVCRSVSVFDHNSTSEYILSNSNLQDIIHFMLHYFYFQMFWFDLVTFIHTLLMNTIHSIILLRWNVWNCFIWNFIAYTYILCNIAAMEKFKDKYTIVEKNTIMSWDNESS